MTEIIKTPSVDLNIDEFTHNVETDIVSGTVTGDGIFDTLMETATKHLLAQFESNRIRQEDYANAYIHIYEVTLQAALKAWLEKDLVAAQIRQTEAGTAKIEAETAHTIAEMEMIQPQIAKIEADTENTKAATAKIIAETELLPLQKEILAVEKQKVEAEIRLVEPQIEKLEAETGKIIAETELLPLQKDILIVEKAKVEAETTRIENETKLVQPQIDKLEAETAKTEAELQLIPKQIELMTAQIASENAKVALAEKQKDLVTAQTASEAGKKALYKRQIEGFDEDFKHKLIKVMMDSWAVGFSVAKDSFEASGIPAPMQQATINKLYNDYIVTELDKFTYNRTDF